MGIDEIRIPKLVGLNMGKFLLLGDPHFRPVQFSTGLDLLHWVEKIAEEHKVDAIINLGDTFDTHGVIRSEILCEFDQHLRRVNEKKIEYFWVLGNHEFYKAGDPKYNVLSIFQNKYKKVTTIIDPATINGMFFFPYTHEPIEISSIDTKLAFTHNTFSGCYFDKSRMADSGYNPNNFLFDLVVSGHIHKTQTVGKVFYPGTPYAQSAAEVDEAKGVYLLDSETLYMEFIPSPFPMWRSIRIDIENATELNLNKIDKFIITLVGSKAGVSSFLSSKSATMISKECSVVFKGEFTDKEKDKRFKIDHHRDFSDIIKVYFDSVYNVSADKDKIKEAIIANSQ